MIHRLTERFHSPAHHSKYNKKVIPFIAFIVVIGFLGSISTLWLQFPEQGDEYVLLGEDAFDKAACIKDCPECLYYIHAVYHDQLGSTSPDHRELKFQQCCIEHSSNNGLRHLTKVVNKAFADAGVRYYIEAGTLLGQNRFGEFNPWEDDVDFNIDDRDEQTFLDVIVPRLEREGLVFEPCQSFMFYFFGPCVGAYTLYPPKSNHGVHLDVFPFYMDRDRPEIKPALWQKKRKDLHHFTRDMVLPLRRCEFIGLETFCPNNPTAYLTEFYGDIEVPWDRKDVIVPSSGEFPRHVFYEPLWNLYRRESDLKSHSDDLTG